MTGSITLVMGPMFAGKTTELMRRVKRELFAQRRCALVKYSKDTRYSDQCVATHDKQKLQASFSAATLRELGEQWRAYDVIAIDEGQFFPDLLEFCTEAADGGKTVIVCALDGDYMRQPFGKVCQLIPLCETVQKITAVCMHCHIRDAAFTKRTVYAAQQEVIGGAEMYSAVCRECYNSAVPPTPGKMTKYRRTRDMIDGKENVTSPHGLKCTPLKEEPSTKKQCGEAPNGAPKAVC